MFVSLALFVIFKCRKLSNLGIVIYEFHSNQVFCSGKNEVGKCWSCTKVGPAKVSFFWCLLSGIYYRILLAIMIILFSHDASSCSAETRKKIAVGVRIGWQRRHEKLLLQETCLFDWQNLIAEAGRQGFQEEEELQWDSYKIMNEQLHQEWLASIELR